MLEAGNLTHQIKETNAENFEADVLMASQNYPVIVDFWAPWCGPCKALGPVLEAAVTQAGPDIRMVKVNIDENPELAQALRVQSVPTVYAFYQGQPVDGFTGAQPESKIKELIQKLLSLVGGNGEDHGLSEEQIEAAIGQAEGFLNEGRLEDAYNAYGRILGAIPKNPRAVSGFVRCFIAMDQLEEAQTLLDNLPLELNGKPEIESVKTALELATQSADAGDVAELKKRLDKKPNDYQARYDLAGALFAAGEQEQAIDELLEIMKRKKDWNEDAARVQLLKFFEALGPTHELTLSGRRKLSSMLFS